jgi:ubiquinone/menaquinone biosynthesis C-methylase UbiE
MTSTHGLVIHWAARYDVLAWLFTGGREGAFRERLLERADIQHGQSVLDIGCGTGTLAIAAAAHVGPAGSVVGIDPSPQMVARATRKAAKAGARATFHRAVAEQLPFPDTHFDLVLSTLMFHHLPRKTRRQCAFEIRRVLKPGGCVFVADFDKPQDRRGLLARFHRHGHAAMPDVEAVLVDAGMKMVRSGPVGFRDLHFVVAQAL